jgi:hypothetical protein
LRMTYAHDWGPAAAEWEKLAAVFPERPDYPFNLAVCLEQLADSVGAARWYARAAALPGATAPILAAARRTEARPRR